MAKVYSWKIGSPNCRWKRKINIILPVIYNIILLYLIIEWASALVPPTPLFGGPVERGRERERKRESSFVK
jgi:hypothetical protein